MDYCAFSVTFGTDKLSYLIFNTDDKEHIIMLPIKYWGLLMLDKYSCVNAENMTVIDFYIKKDNGTKILGILSVRLCKHNGLIIVTIDISDEHYTVKLFNDAFRNLDQWINLWIKDDK